MRFIALSIRRNIAQNKATYGLIAFYVPLCAIAAMWSGHPERFSLLVYSKAVATSSMLIAVLFLSAVCGRIMFVDRPRRLIAAIADEMKNKWLTRERLAQGFPLVFLYMVFMASFSSMKSLIPVFQSYEWDALWIDWDRILHMGYDPWIVTHAVFGGPLATFILNLLYNMWFPVMIAALYWQAFSLSDPALHKRFFLSFYLTWIVNGTLLAILFSSVGPCFYDRLSNVAAFTPLMDRLRDMNDIYPVWALSTQDMLWDLYKERELAVGSGISAMPSVHVAMAFLLFLLGLKKGRVWAYGFFAFFMAILIGSVHLGWHYAVDGYLAMAVTGAIWWGVGRFYKDRA